MVIKTTAAKTIFVASSFLALAFAAPLAFAANGGDSSTPTNPSSVGPSSANPGAPAAKPRHHHARKSHQQQPGTQQPGGAAANPS